jgi:predicted GNAT family acetyltransferase
MQFNAIKHDMDLRRFTLPIDDTYTAIIDYYIQAEIYYLTHSEVPIALRGQGIGKILVEKTYEYLSENNIKTVPICAYIKAIAQTL